MSVNHSQRNEASNKSLRKVSKGGSEIQKASWIKQKKTKLHGKGLYQQEHLESPLFKVLNCSLTIQSTPSSHICEL